jgi:RNA polymerase sigma-70 factor (ECF subfamily)
VDLDRYLPDIARGDTVAFAHWVAATEFTVRRSVQRYATRVDVEVVIQETLLRMWQVAPRVVVDGQHNSLLRLALRTAHNLALDELRRSRRFVPQDNDPEQSAELGDELRVEALETDPGLRHAIVHCHEQLPEKPAQALLARVQSAGGDPDDVLAARLHMRLNTFHQNLARARKLIAECLRRAGVELLGVSP